MDSVALFIQIIRKNVLFLLNSNLRLYKFRYNVENHDGDMSETKLTERQQKILNLIKESPTITGKQMSEMLSVSQRTIERDISALQKLGVLKREGKDNDGVWVIIVKI